MPEFSPRSLHSFMQTVSAELGADNFVAVVEKAGLPLPSSDIEAAARLDASAAAQAYADVQKALRTYYGRGARGILLRVGAQMWKRLLADAPLTHKPQITLARGLATRDHPKPALDLLVRLFATKPGDITVHTLDLNLLVVDHASPSTSTQRDDEPICWVTVGLLRESLYWATNREFDVTETSCRALGAQTCEFHINTGV